MEVNEALNIIERIKSAAPAFDRLDELVKFMANSEAVTKDWKKQVESAKGELDGLLAQVKSMRAEKDKLESQLSMLKDEVEGLKGRLRGVLS